MDSRLNVFIISILLILLVNSKTYSQYYDIGQDPAGTSWKQISTNHFKIIFPKQNEKQAQDLANYIESIYIKSTKTLISKPKNIPIILHTESVISNAYSIWAPKRMEFYTIPPQDSYGQEWMQQLAIHEFRHIIQINKLSQSSGKILYYIFGEQITGALTGLYLPSWFMEGDAVCSETSLSQTGRGRLPSFEMQLKAQILNKNIFTYDKAVFGSYKDFIPNQYILGYHMTAYNRKKYGAGLWDNTLNFVACHPMGITSFSRGIKKQTGFNKSELYYNTMKELDSLWEKQQLLIKASPIKELTNTQIAYTNYTHPHYLNDSTIITVKKGIDDITRFVTIDKQKKEKIIYTPGFLFTETFSVADSTLVWAEITYDLRWDNRKYSTIKILDLKSGKCKSIQPKSFLFAPTLSKDRKLIAAIENNPNGENNIVIIDTHTGNIINKIKSPENNYLITPSWNNDNNNIVLIAVSSRGKSLITYNIETSRYSTIIPFNYEEISMPIFFENFIIYNAAYSGIDNIYAIDTISKQKYQITSSMYGAENLKLSPNKKYIIYSDYTSGGFNIVESVTEKNKWLQYDNVENTSIQLYKTIAKQELYNKNDTLIVDSIYKTKKYSKTKNIFNIHSWGPLCIDAENTSVNPGFSILSQNLLSTAFTTLGYKYNYNEKTGNYFVNFTYKGLFPIFDLKMSKGKRASTYLNQHNENIRYDWNETKIISGVCIPFNISKGKYYRIIEPQVNYSYTYIQHNISTPSNFIYGALNTIDYGIQFYNQIKSVEKDMRPRWGQTIELYYSNTPFKGLNLGKIYALAGKFNFPGIIKHHSFKLSLGYQKKKYGTYAYSDYITLPRGVLTFQNKEIKTIYFDYKMPVAYPDYSIPNIIYIKRIKANLFYDFALYNGSNKIAKYQSTGIETTLDFHLFRFIAPIDAGLRCTYLPINKHFYTELLYQIKFDNL